MRVCTTCGVTKDGALFPKKGAQCKVCVAARDKAYVTANRQKIQARKNEWQRNKRRMLAENAPKILSPLELARLAGETTYFSGNSCINGHIAPRLVVNRSCCECNKQKQAAYIAANIEVVTQKRRAYYKRRLEQYPEKVAAIAKKSVAKHRVRRNAEKAAWRRKNKARVLAWVRNRQLAKQQRTPAWLSDDDRWMIEQAYEIAAVRAQLFGFPWHVDHVIPLSGKLVSGLHVPNNLRVIPGVENLRKNNRYLLEV